MPSPLYLPMGLMWHMPVPVACSLAVAAHGLAVTCGQCPLDRAGAVQHPDDAPAQAELVARMCQTVLDHLPTPHHAAMLLVYHDAPDEAAILAPLRAQFPQALIVPIRLPHFYYPGMRIEVDMFATESPPRLSHHSIGEGTISIADGSPLQFANLTAPDSNAAAPLLAQLRADHLLSAHWVASRPVPAAFDPNPTARLMPVPAPDGITQAMTGVFILSPNPVTITETPGGAGLRMAPPFAWAAATGTDPDLARAAHQAMDALSLPNLPNFTQMKGTTHYAGGPGPDALHGNLAVRHARFAQPGPASTGVPVQGFAAIGQGRATIAVDLLGLIDSAASTA